jgi:hypothetical protein
MKKKRTRAFSGMIFKKVILLSALYFFCLNTFLVAQNNNADNQTPIILGGSCASPDGPMMDYTGGQPTYATANASGWCLSGLTAGQTYCFYFTYPTNTTLELDWQSSGCAACNYDYLSINTSTGGYTLSSGGSCASAINTVTVNCTAIDISGSAACTDCAPDLYDKNCVLMHSNGFMAGLGCGMVYGDRYTYCFKVPAGCGGMSLCPMVKCQTGYCASLMPVELLYFSGVNINGIVQLNWATASERNNNYFTIERSQNAADFEPLTTVKGAGNSSSTLYYQTVDEKPLPGVSYYRLKQTDFDGAYVYYNIVSVKNSSALSVYPTVSSGLVAITGMDDLNSEITVYSMMGEKVYETPSLKGEGKQSQADGGKILDLSSLPNGIYVIGVKTEKNLYTQKLVIQK